MDYKTAIKTFDTLGSDEQSKELYAHFGVAIYFSQVLEQQAINMIAMCKHARNEKITEQEIEELWNGYDRGSRTFGILINEVKQLYEISEEDEIELKQLLKLRN